MCLSRWPPEMHLNLHFISLHLQDSCKESPSSSTMWRLIVSASLSVPYGLPGGFAPISQHRAVAVCPTAPPSVQPQSQVTPHVGRTPRVELVHKWNGMHVHVGQCLEGRGVEVGSAPHTSPPPQPGAKILYRQTKAELGRRRSLVGPWRRRRVSVDEDEIHCRTKERRR